MINSIRTNPCAPFQGSGHSRFPIDPRDVAGMSGDASKLSSLTPLLLVLVQLRICARRCRSDSVHIPTSWRSLSSVGNIVLRRRSLLPTLVRGDSTSGLLDAVLPLQLIYRSVCGLVCETCHLTFCRDTDWITDYSSIRGAGKWIGRAGF